MDNSARRQSVTSLLKRLSIWWVVALLLAAVLIPAGWDVGSPNVPGCIFIATCISIDASLGLWLGFGHSAIRLVVIPVTTLATTALLFISVGGPFTIEGFLMLLFLAGVVIGVVAGPIAVARVVRRGTLDRVPEKSVQNGTERPEALQFRIVHLFVLTTAVAVLTLLAKTLWPHFQASGGQNAWLLALKLGFTLGICSLVVIWSTLGRDAMLRTVVSASVTAGLASLNYWIIRSEIGWLWLSMTLIVWGQTTVLMWLMRIEGFRFVANTVKRDTSS